MILEKNAPFGQELISSFVSKDFITLKCFCRPKKKKQLDDEGGHRMGKIFT